MFHLANISYEGEVSGFERIIGPRRCFPNFTLGILMALIEAWTAVGWVSACLGIVPVTFNSFFENYKSILSNLNPESEITNLCLTTKNVSGTYKNIRGLNTTDAYGNDITERMQKMLFAYRYPNDINNFINAVTLFLNGLHKIYSGEIETMDTLRKWEKKNKFSAAEQIRIQNDVGGDYLEGNRNRFIIKKGQQFKSSNEYLSMLSKMKYGKSYV